MKSIEKVVSSYNSESLSFNELQSFLSFHDWSVTTKQNQYTKRVTTKIVDTVNHSTSTHVPNPESTFIAEEDADGFNDLLEVFKKLCSKRDFEIYTSFYVYGEKQAKLAEDYSLSRSAISMIILRVNTKIRKYLARHPDQLVAFKSFLFDKIYNKE